MDTSEFFTAYLNNILADPSRLALDCSYCPLREQCRTDEFLRVKAGLEGETCEEYLARVLTT